MFERTVCILSESTIDFDLNSFEYLLISHETSCTVNIFLKEFEKISIFNYLKEKFKSSVIEKINNNSFKFAMKNVIFIIDVDENVLHTYFNNQLIVNFYNVIDFMTFDSEKKYLDLLILVDLTLSFFDKKYKSYYGFDSKYHDKLQNYIQKNKKEVG